MSSLPHMAIDRSEVRRRVRTITAWAAGGAAAATAAFAFGAARGTHAAAKTPASPSVDTQDDVPQQSETIPQDQGQGFAPPSASTSPPQAMSGGS